MVEIHVIFPDKGGVAVSSLGTLAFKREMVNWVIHCQNTSITEVRIRFDSTTATFFRDSNKGAPNVAPYNEFGEKFIDETIIWGRAPVAAPGRVVNKYTISGLDSTGYVVAELDPTIITEDPPP
jgi:hypothetical protein